MGVQVLIVLLDFVFVLAFSVIFGLTFNIVTYLWFSALVLIVFGSGSLFGWFGVVLGFQLGFYFYLFRLDQQYFFNIFTNVLFLVAIIFVFFLFLYICVLFMSLAF